MNVGTGDALTAAERSTLRAIVLRCGEEPFTTEALEQGERGRLTGYAAELGVERLRQRGIVETRRKSWGETIHALAPGLLADWLPAFAEGLTSRGAVDEASVAQAIEPRAGFAQRLFGFVAEAAYGGIALTQKGTFHKRDLARLEARFPGHQPALDGLDIAYHHRDKLDKRLAVLYDAALRLGLLRNGVARVECVPERIEAWLALDARARDAALLELWWDVYTPADVWLQLGAAALKRLPPGRWFDADAMFDALRDAGGATGGRSREDALRAIREYWIEPMASFGWLDVGTVRGRDGALAVRRPAPEEPGDEGWYVQPDFEVIVPPDAPYAARWALESFAEYAGGDAVDRYRLTRAAWERALQAGGEPDRLIETLRRHALYGLPEPVETTLSQWSASFGAVVVEEVTLLRCRHQSDADFLRGDPSVAGCIAAQIGEKDFVVRASEAKRLVELLKRQGFSPLVRKEGEASARDAESAGERTGGERDAGGRSHGASSDGSGSSAPGSFARIGEGIVHSRRSALAFPLDPSPAGTAELRAKLSRVPQAWLTTLRSYHATTVRDLLQTAIDVRTSVRLNVDGRAVVLVPKRIQAIGGEWLVQGFVDGEPATVRSSDCREAQLLVPEQA